VAAVYFRFAAKEIQMDIFPYRLKPCQHKVGQRMQLCFCKVVRASPEEIRTGDLPPW
jgi:hypothetical protein